MNLADIVQRLGLQVCAGADRLEEKEVTGGYVCDLLSYVMARAKGGDLWLTVQGHPNIVAVASLVNLAGVVVTEGAKIDPATVEKADQEDIPLLATSLTTYEVAGKLWELGVR